MNGRLVSMALILSVTQLTFGAAESSEPAKAGYRFTVDKEGDDLVVRNVACTRFGGADDKGDPGITESGLLLRAKGRDLPVAGCALPMRGYTENHYPGADTSSSPIPALPYLKTFVKITYGGKSITVPLIDRGPAPGAASHAAIDLTDKSFVLLSSNSKEGILNGVDYRILGAAKYLDHPYLPPDTVAPIVRASPLDKNTSSLIQAFYREANLLAARRIKFDDDWLPPGESQLWKMDCSNTVCYLFKKVTGIILPRMASDQYLCLQKQGKAWDIPDAGKNPDAEQTFLREHLKPGDLLFWENTCLPVHDLPITHVMIFLGRDKQGLSIMAGSQTAHRIPGFFTGWIGGADIYIYDPTTNIGGYVTPQMVFRVGHLRAYGRPLEVDTAKLAQDIAQLP